MRTVAMPSRTVYRSDFTLHYGSLQLTEDPSPSCVSGCAVHEIDQSGKQTAEGPSCGSCREKQSDTKIYFYELWEII